MIYYCLIKGPSQLCIVMIVLLLAISFTMEAKKKPTAIDTAEMVVNILIPDIQIVRGLTNKIGPVRIIIENDNEVANIAKRYMEWTEEHPGIIDGNYKLKGPVRLKFNGNICEFRSPGIKEPLRGNFWYNENTIIMIFENPKEYRVWNYKIDNGTLQTHGWGMLLLGRAFNPTDNGRGKYQKLIDRFTTWIIDN